MRTIIRTKLYTLVGFVTLAACVCPALTASSARADEPSVKNAKLETRAVAGSLAATTQQLVQESASPLWIGYSVEKVAGDRSICCGDHGDAGGIGCGTCTLENEHNSWSGTRHQKETVNLEGGGKLVVLLRVANKQVMRIRTASADCTLDAGGLRFVWLTGLKSDESVALLTSYVRLQEFGRDADQGLAGQALAAIAMHAGVPADRAMASFIAPEQPSELRKKASFWLGAARGKAGLPLLAKMAKADPSGDVRAQVAFALYVSPEPQAVDEMIRMAHDDHEPHVRGQALFWLAQKAGAKAAGAINGAIENDPDTEVKKKAVFALSQMPREEGVLKLIQVAETNKNPEVRKQAMFWLGQSSDPRALQFFERILAR
jgi:HEAT repeats